MLIAIALLGVGAIALVLVASRRVQRGDRAQLFSVDSAQVEGEVYERLYGKPPPEISPARPVERPREAQGETHPARRTQPSRKIGEPGTGPGSGTRGPAVHGSVRS